MRYPEMLVTVSILAWFPTGACAQSEADYPAKSVRVIVASSPGGGTDVQARMFAQKLSESMKQQFTIDKRLTADGAEAVGNTPDQFKKIIATEIPRWQKAAKDAGVRGE